MKAFHNNPSLKEKYLTRVRYHQAADNLIRGTGWDNGKGCAIGCTLEDYNHAKYESELGIPEWLARVEDTLFEGMSEKKSRTWPEVFLSAIKVGDDLERIKGPFLVMVLKSTLNTFDHDSHPDVVKVINRVVSLWEAPETKNSAAKMATAAKAAEAAASKATTEMVWVATAACAAEAAAWAASKAAAAPAKAATWAAKVAAKVSWKKVPAPYDYFADELIKMLKN